MLEVFDGKVRKTGFFQKAGFPGNTDKNFGIYHIRNTDTMEPHRDQQISESRPQRKGFVRRFLRGSLKLAAYLVFLGAMVSLIFWGLEKLSYIALTKTFLGPVYPHDFKMALRDYTRPVSHYDYDFVPRVCIEYNTNKGNRYEYANNAGFREPRDLSTDKPADEFRIFLTGGSTAFGMGAGGEATAPMGWYSVEYRETISHMMEMILNATAPIPGKKIRVYNTAVWGYAYQHHLMRYLTKLRRYKPDMIVSFDGANEIPLVSRLYPEWDYFKEGQYNYILRQIFQYNGPGLASYLTLWLKNNTYLMSYIWSGKDLFVELNQAQALTTGLPENTPSREDQASLSVEARSRMVDENIATVVRMVENYHSVLENDGVTHLLALQPWFYLSTKPLHEKEKILAGLKGHRDYHDVPSDKMYKLLAERLRESANRKQYFLVDFSEYFDDVSDWVFTDWCHLTAEANYLIAKELSNLVKEQFFSQPLSQGDRIEEKDGYFLDLAAMGTVLYAPQPESDAVGTDKMFSGYPSDALYASRAVGPEEKLEVLLDLGRAIPVSRLRLVWADEASVPGEWIMETSTDTETWQPFVQARRDQADNFAKWPGFEYYAAEPAQARYVRYRPLNGQSRVIKLRLWSMFR
jgi:hypothetical protein